MVTTVAGAYAGWLMNAHGSLLPSVAEVKPLEQAGASLGEPRDGAAPETPRAEIGASQPRAAVGSLRTGATAPPALVVVSEAFEVGTRAEGPSSAPVDATQSLARARALLTEGQFVEAREALRQARDRFPRVGEIRGLLERSFDEDPGFAPPVATLRPKQDLTAIRRLGGGSTITLKFKQGKDTTAAFKPLQTRRQSNYRSEIASWRLCQLIGCSFDIPYNRPVRIRRRDFDTLYSMKDAKQRSYARNFTDLEWKRDGGEVFLYGTEKAWVLDFTKFPVEYTDGWRDWLSQREDVSALEEPLAKALRVWFDDSVTAKLYRSVLNHAGDLTTHQLARQLSDMLVFDFLVGNWDRFSSVKDWWGANCQFAKGRLVSIDNGAAFPTFATGRVRARFMHVERFSRSFIRELRLLDKARTLHRLFPDATPQEVRRFERFWRQRTEVLERVDQLIARYGRDEVLLFE